MKDNVINPKEIYRDGYLRALRRLEAYAAICEKEDAKVLEEAIRYLYEEYTAEEVNRDRMD